MKLLFNLLILLLFKSTLLPASAPDSVKLVHLSAEVEMKFKWIPPGSFMMGSPDDELNRDGDEGPLHRVSISKGFYLGVYEVTQHEWVTVMGENPAIFRHGDNYLDRPVESVSWSEVNRFIEVLNERGKGTFRLPTEAEWEFACRAGTESSYYWSNADNWIIHQYAWCNSRSFATTHRVGEKIANPWGLHDMCGNVWEWTQDWYGPYSGEHATDPKGPAEGTAKVFRGGSWFDFPNSQRSANRHRHEIENGYTAIGFRLVWEEGS